MRYRFANRVTALVTSTVAIADLTVTMETGAGALFPPFNVGDVVQATLIATSGAHEIVQVTGITGDVATVVRGQEGSAAATFPAGSRIEIRLTAAVLQSFIQRFGDTMQGNLDMAGHSILRPAFSGPVVFTTIHATAIRAADVASDAPLAPATENAIVIPLNTNPSNNDARRPTIFGRPIITAGMMETIVMDAWIDVNNVPSYFRLCDGTLSTPDLRGKFIRGWSDTAGLGSQGGQERWATDLAGTHGHGGITVNQTTGLSVTINGRNYHLDGSPGGNDYVGQSATMNPASGVHSHGINPDGNHQHLVTVLPPYYVLVKVMWKI